MSGTVSRAEYNALKAEADLSRNKIEVLIAQMGIDEAQTKSDEAVTASRVPVITDLKTRVAAIEAKLGMAPAT